MILPLLVALVAQGTASAPAPSNVLTAAERAAGWRLLFDGRTLKGWRGLGYDSVPTAHWVVVDGAIKKIASGKVPRLPDGQPLNGGDLMTVDTFGDFELTWEWRGSPPGHNGGQYKNSPEHSAQKAPKHPTPCVVYKKLEEQPHPPSKNPPPPAR